MRNLFRLINSLPLILPLNNIGSSWISFPFSFSNMFISIKIIKDSSLLDSLVDVSGIWIIFTFFQHENRLMNISFFLQWICFLKLNEWKAKEDVPRYPWNNRKESFLFQRSNKKWSKERCITLRLENTLILLRKILINDTIVCFFFHWTNFVQVDFYSSMIHFHLNSEEDYCWISRLHARVWKDTWDVHHRVLNQRQSPLSLLHRLSNEIWSCPRKEFFQMLFREWHRKNELLKETLKIPFQRYFSLWSIHIQNLQQYEKYLIFFFYSISLEENKDRLRETLLHMRRQSSQIILIFQFDHEIRSISIFKSILEKHFVLSDKNTSHINSINIYDQHLHFSFFLDIRSFLDISNTPTEWCQIQSFLYCPRENIEKNKKMIFD